MLIKGRGKIISTKNGSVDAIDHFHIWTQQWGEGRSNDKMNGGRTVGELKKGGSVLRQRKKWGSILKLRQNGRRTHLRPNK